MGYRELLDALGRQVEEEKVSMLGEADRRGRLILDEAKRETERLSAAFAAEDFRDANLEKEKALAVARQETAIASLGLRREAVATVRREVEAALGGLREKPSYRVLMGLLIDEVRKEMEDVGEWTVDGRDVRLVEEILKEKKISGAKVVRGGECLGGIVASSRDGRSRVLNTLEARLVKAWAGLEADIGPDLSGEVK